MADVFLGIGSNEGDRESNIKMALDLIDQHDRIKVRAVSSLYETKPLGVSVQPDYINCAIRVRTELKPHELLKAVKSVEDALGREPNSHMLPRPIDIDILLFDDMHIDTVDLMIPHSRIKSRRFVIEPLLELDPGIIEPVSSTPLRDFLKEVSSQVMKKVKESKEVWGG